MIVNTSAHVGLLNLAILRVVVVNPNHFAQTADFACSQCILFVGYNVYNDKPIDYTKVCQFVYRNSTTTQFYKI